MILIVEDTEHIRKLVKAILKNENIDMKRLLLGKRHSIKFNKEII